MQYEFRILRRESLVFNGGRYYKIRMKLRYPYFPASEPVSEFYKSFAAAIFDTAFESDVFDSSKSRRFEKSAVRLDIVCDFSCNSDSDCGTGVSIKFAAYCGRVIAYEKTVIHSWVKIGNEYYLARVT